MKSIEIKNLKKYFKDVKAVDDISFEVEEGELFAFLGLNGAGKSTTINIICGTYPLDAGEVKINGMSIDNDMDKIKPLLGVVFQDSILDAKLSGYDNLVTRAGLYDISNEEFKENLQFLSEKLELKDILNRPLNKLSGGQRRRIDLARALIHKPKILILDEPTTGLDPNTRRLVWRLIDYLRKTEKLTVLLTTHYMEEASEANNVVIMDTGKIVARGTPNELKDKYAFDSIKVLKHDTDLVSCLTNDEINYSVSEDVIKIDCESTMQALDLLNKYKNHIKDFEVCKGKMDDVFLNVTGKNLKENL